MRKLEAKVEKNLMLSDAGVSQYMTVDAKDAGPMMILPSPNYSSIFAQVTTSPGDTMKVEEVGKTGDTNWGIILNSQGQQYGTNMSYEPGHLRSMSQIIYVPSGEYFKRSNLKKLPGNEKTMRKSTVDITLFNNYKISVRYSALGTGSSMEDLEKFQGFVVCMNQGGSPVYRVWFDLNAESFRKASTDDNYNSIKGLIPQKIFSFISAGKKFDPAVLEARVKSSVDDRKYASLLLESLKGKASFQVRPGNYDVEKLIMNGIAPEGISQKTQPLLDEALTHLVENRPFSFNGSEISKTQNMNFSPGSNYHLTIVSVVSESPAKQPVQAPKNEYRETPKQQLETASVAHQQPSIKDKPKAKKTPAKPAAGAGGMKKREEKRQQHRSSAGGR